MTATLAASHCETYTLELVVLPPPEEATKSRNLAYPGVQGAAAGGPVSGPQSVGFVVSTGTPALVGMTLLMALFPVFITSTCVLTQGNGFPRKSVQVAS